MGVALLAGPANVIMQLARPGVGYGVMEISRRERSGGPASDQTGPHDVHLSGSGHGWQRSAEGRLPRRGRTRRTPRCIRRTTARSNTTRSTRTSSCGSPPACTRAPSTCTACSSGRWTTRPPSAITARGWRWAPRCRCRPRCGRPTGRHSSGTGRNRWTRCTSTTPSASTCIRSPPAGCAGMKLPGPLQRLTESLRAAGHDGLSAATVSRRDAATGYGCQVAGQRRHQVEAAAGRLGRVRRKGRRPRRRCA